MSVHYRIDVDVRRMLDGLSCLLPQHDPLVDLIHRLNDERLRFLEALEAIRRLEPIDMNAVIHARDALSDREIVLVEDE